VSPLRSLCSIFYFIFCVSEFRDTFLLVAQMSFQRNTAVGCRLLILKVGNHPLTARPESSDDVAGLRSGSPEAWGALCETYGERLWRYVARLVGSNRDAVADAVQETLLAAARSASKFDSERGTVWTWLTGIAQKQVALHWRKVATRRVDPAEPHFDDSPGGGASPEANLLTDDSVEQVRQILADLPTDYASYLVAKYNDGLSIDEMVGQFGGTADSVRSRLARARREFKRRYEAAVAEAGRSG